MKAKCAMKGKVKKHLKEDIKEEKKEISRDKKLIKSIKGMKNGKATAGY